MKDHIMDLIVAEVKNFAELKEKHDYADVDDLIAHYIEEQVITSTEELAEVVENIRLRVGIAIEPDHFKTSGNSRGTKAGGLNYEERREL